MMGLRPRYQILGQLHEVLTTCLTESFVLHSTQQPCKHPLWYQKTGTDQITLSHHVKMHSLAPGWMIVKVEPCGLTHRMAELLNPLWQRLTKRLRGGSRSLLSSQHVLTRNGGGIASSITRLDLLRVGLSLEIRPTQRRFQAP